MAWTKVQDRAEAKRWLEEGRSYQWIVDEYRRKYNIDTTRSMWAMMRDREGIEPRAVIPRELIPWKVLPEHRNRNPAIMLRAESRRRAGKSLSPRQEGRLESWLDTLESESVVVTYHPDRGWMYVPRQDTDTDIIRQPKTRER